MLVGRGLARSRAQAVELIDSGAVIVGGRPILRPSARVEDGADIDVDDPRPDYVGRGGHKLDAALDHFAIEVSGVAALDIGASTGGFTDCLLRRRVGSVVAVDVGSDQLADRVRHDGRVRSLERTDVRSVVPSDLGGPFAVVVVDLSFISTIGLASHIAAFVADRGSAVVLIKPQFEAGRAALDKRGVVTDPSTRLHVGERARSAFEAAGLSVVGVLDSPIAGGSGNRELLLAAQRRTW